MHGIIHPGQTPPDGSGWEAYYDNGREHSGLDAVEWAKRGAALGAGEILLTSVDSEGLGRGMERELIRAVAGAVNVPVIAAGGAAGPEDVALAAEDGASAVALSSLLHYKRMGVGQMESCAGRPRRGGEKMKQRDPDRLRPVQPAQRPAGFRALWGKGEIARSPAAVLNAAGAGAARRGGFPGWYGRAGTAGTDRPHPGKKAAAGTPLLGICLGMQMLLTRARSSAAGRAWA